MQRWMWTPHAGAPQALVVPLGLGTFEGDPISGFKLRNADYLQLGRAIAQLGLPTVLTFEGLTRPTGNLIREASAQALQPPWVNSGAAPLTSPTQKIKGCQNHNVQKRPVHLAQAVRRQMRLQRGGHHGER